MSLHLPALLSHRRFFRAGDGSKPLTMIVRNASMPPARVRFYPLHGLVRPVPRPPAVRGVHLVDGIAEVLVAD